MDHDSHDGLQDGKALTRLAVSDPLHQLHGRVQRDGTPPWAAARPTAPEAGHAASQAGPRRALVPDRPDDERRPRVQGMSRTAQKGTGSSAARLLGLLAVLLGLLAMHGLASTQHSSAAVLVPAVPHSVGTDADRTHGHASHADAGHPLDAVRPTVTARAAEASVTALPGPVCDGDCQPGGAVLCLAVLVAAGAATLLAAAARRAVGPHLPARPSTAGPPAPRRAPTASPDPVKDLCVSRT